MALLAPYFLYDMNKLSQQNIESRVFLIIYSRINGYKGKMSTLNQSIFTPIDVAHAY